MLTITLCLMQQQIKNKLKCCLVIDIWKWSCFESNTHQKDLSLNKLINVVLFFLYLKVTHSKGLKTASCKINKINKKIKWVKQHKLLNFFAAIAKLMFVLRLNHTNVE